MNNRGGGERFTDFGSRLARLQLGGFIRRFYGGMEDRFR